MKVDKKWSSVIGTVLIAAIVLALIIGVSDTPPSWATWGVAAPALAVLAVTAAARLQDISGRGKRYFFRRLGMILVGAGCGALLLAPILGYSNSFPTWRGAVVYLGMALAWVTTPNMPPWWRYISGEYKLPKGVDA